MTVLPKFWNIVPNICKKLPQQQDKNLKIPELLTSLHLLPSLPIPDKIFRFPDEFYFSPKTDLLRVDATRKSGFPTFLLKFQYSRVLYILWVDM